jgi:hypothetical protein
MPRSTSIIAAVAASAVIAAASALPVHAATPTRTAAIYYLGNTGTRSVLYREFRQVPVVGGPIRTAVDAMLHMPPRDPNYFMAWPYSTTVRGISVSGGVATVDLAGPDLTGHAGFTSTCTPLQQLVYTVTAASPSVSRVLLQFYGRGRVVSDFWGTGSGCGSDVIARRPGPEILAPVQISNLVHAQFVPRSFIVSGEATVFESVVSWSVRDQATRRVLRSGSTLANTMGSIRGPWAVRINLPVTEVGGAVVVSAWEASAKNGAVTGLDDKALRVR